MVMVLFELIHSFFPTRMMFASEELRRQIFACCYYQNRQTAVAKFLRRYISTEQLQNRQNDVNLLADPRMCLHSLPSNSSCRSRIHQ